MLCLVATRARSHPRTPTRAPSRSSARSGVTDTYLSTSKAGVDTWNVITNGSRVFRAPSGSQPQPNIPTNAGAHRVRNINYYSRDVRRNLPVSQDLPLSASLSPANALLLPPRDAALVEKPEEGSPGMKVRRGGGARARGGCARGRRLTPPYPAQNPDVTRYDPTGLRTTMTANWTSLQRSLDAVRPNHLPVPPGDRARQRGALRPTAAAAAQPARFVLGGGMAAPDSRKRGWAYTQASEF